MPGDGTFSVFCGCDVFGEKLNYEFRFAGPPLPGQLRDAATRVFCDAAQNRRPPGAPPEAARLSVRKLTVYTGGEGAGGARAQPSWEDLTSAGQLRDGCQVYLLQHPSQWHTEVPGTIPHPGRTFTFNGMDMLPEPAPSSPLGIGSPYGGAPLAVGFPATPTTRTPHGLPRGSSAVRPMDAGSAPRQRTAVQLQSASARDKASRVFDELDVQRQGALSDSAFVRGLLQHFYVRVDEARVRRIFQRTDTDGDGVITRSDFERFAADYPALLDALYFRAIDREVDGQQRREIRSAQEGVAQAQRGCGQAQQALGKAEADSAAGRRQLQQADEAAGQSRRREQGYRDRAAEAARGAGEGEARLQEAVAAFNDTQEDEDRCRAAIQEAIHEQEIAERRMAQQRHELQRANERLEELRRELQEQHDAVLRLQQTLGDCEAHTAAAARRRGDATVRAQEQERVSADARDAVSAAEQLIARYRGEQAEYERKAQEAAEEVERCEAKRALDDRAQRGLYDRVRQAQRLCEESQRRLEEQQRALRQREEENAALRQRRRDASGEEEELIDQEVRLREQRDALERSEHVLRNRHTDFSRAMGEQQQQQQQQAIARSMSPGAVH